MLVIASPGQGAQKPGFLAPWLELDSVAELSEHLSQAAGVDIAQHGVHSDASTIRDTAIAQPLLVAASIITHSILFGGLNSPRPQFYAGHSVGEVAAAAHAGVMEDAAAMRFVAARSQAMAKAARAHDTSMTAILGGNRDEVMAAITASGAVAANINGSAQVVAAGSREQLERLAAAPPAKARLIPLEVAGAFHSPFMAEAREALAAAAGEFSVQDPQIPFISNADGSVLTSGHSILASLVSQVENTVQWHACMTTMVRQEVTGILELTPAGTLTGLAKRDARSLARFELNSPDQLEDARSFIREHATSPSQEVSQ